MHICSSLHYKHLFISLALLFLLAACNGNSTPVANNAATASAGNGNSSNATAATAPQVKAGAQPCPEAVKDPSYWDAIVVTQANVNKVERVSCANLLGNSSLQALITVRYNGTGALLDVYVYNNITDPNPTQIFKLQNLYKGDARISGYDTLLTAEVDQNSSINKNVSSNAALTQDLFREFQWSAEIGTLVPVAFPAIFPDLTRYQAEAAQAEVNQGHQSWRLSATRTAQALAARLLNWNPNAPAAIVGGNHDLNAVVNVKSTNPGSGSITVSLGRLEGNSSSGIWEATSVTSPGISITIPQDRDRLSNPTTVAGTGSGTVVVLDHLYTNIGQTNVHGSTFSTNVSYNSTFKTGIQEGIVALYSYVGSSISGAVLVKEMLT